jgi:uncharacterized protein
MSAERGVQVIDPAWIPLADGARLCARIWLPENAEAEPVPAILEYLPYRKDDVTAAEDARMYPYFATRGYACARVDIRGSGDSDGLLTDEYSRQEQDDALEVIAWLAAQPWCTASVGMMGISWSGFNSLQVAARRPPALRAIISACSTDDRYDNDVHYYGGVPLGYYLLPWASAMMAFNARPPDPAIVGERWREMWLARLDGNVDLIRTWIEHQSRDDYWRHGSICEDYAAITAAVFLVGGWADAYVDAIFRMLANLTCPRLGLIGPWGHQWPQDGRPGPRVGFLQEALRWWDHWLKGTDTGIMDEPMLRAWMQEPVAPQPDYEQRPGRWIAEHSWPPARAGQRTLRLGTAGDLGDEPRRGERRHRSSQTVGIDAGAWCAYGSPADLPPDQRRDDALSLSFDSAPLSERLELLGQPMLRLTLSSDRERAFVMARLCDVAPDGSSALITRGALNLCHRAGHDRPARLEPATPVEVTIPLKSVAYALVPGHRIRVALSTSYWPWLWPSPEPVTITLATGPASELRLPLRAPDAREPQLVQFGPPEHAPELAVVRLRDRRPEQLFTHDVVAGATGLRMRRDFVGAQRLPSGLEYHDYDPVTFTISGDDPLSARVQCERRIELRRGNDWWTRTELRSTMSADAESYRLRTVIEAYERDEHVHMRTFESTVPRNHS